MIHSYMEMTPSQSLSNFCMPQVCYCASPKSALHRLAAMFLHQLLGGCSAKLASYSVVSTSVSMHMQPSCPSSCSWVRGSLSWAQGRACQVSLLPHAARLLPSLTWKRWCR